MFLLEFSENFPNSDLHSYPSVKIREISFKNIMKIWKKNWKSEKEEKVPKTKIAFSFRGLILFFSNKLSKLPPTLLKFSVISS